MSLCFKDKSISVCMVLFNRWEMSKQCLTDIQNTIPKDWHIEWCLIDNGSSDETKTELENFAKTLRGSIGYLELLDEGLKQTQAVNRTMNAATSKYMLRTDNDIAYQSGWFEDCYKLINDDDFHTKVGFVCPTHHMKEAHGKNYKPSLVRSKHGNEIDMVSNRGQNVPGNLFMLTSVARDIGGFYTPYNLLNSDVHYCLVAKHMGYKWGYTWKTHCPHIGVPDLKTDYSKKSVSERQEESRRLTEIGKGKYDDKHPQEIEFFQKIQHMVTHKGKQLPHHKNINVLIPSSGRRVELVKMFKEVFEIPRWEGKVYTAGCDEYMPSAYFSDEHILLPPIDSPEYIDAIVNVCKDKNISYIFPVIDYDVKVLSQEKMKILRLAGTEVVTPDHENAMMCFDKVKTCELFNELEIKHPDTFSSTASFSNPMDIIIKPRFGFASKEIRVLRNTNSVDVPENFVAQEKIEGIEYTCDLVSDRRFDIISFVARERLGVRGGEIQSGKVVNHLTMFGIFNKISHRLELEGPWNIQYIIDKNNEAYIIEINTRFGGGVPISARAGQNQALQSLKVLERDFFGYHHRYLVEWGLTAMRFDDCVYRHINYKPVNHDQDGSMRLKG